MNQATRDKLSVASAYADSVTDRIMINLAAVPYSWAALLLWSIGCFTLGAWLL